MRRAACSDRARTPTRAWPACAEGVGGRERVAPYEKLVALEAIDELPRTMTGKLLRRVLIERERTEGAVSP